MLKLNDLQFNEGSFKSKKRVARGNAGKATGRGLKGQKARSGVSIKDFQGGQTPLHRRIPKQRSFYTPEKKVAIKLEVVDYLIEMQLIDPAHVINADFFTKIGYVKKNKKYKLIGKTENKLEIEGHLASAGAQESIESKNGKFVKI